MGRTKQVWEVGDIFTIPLDDGDVVIGQVIGHEPQALNSVTIALFDTKTEPGNPSLKTAANEDVFAKLFVTRDLLDAGVWQVVVRGARPAVPSEERPYEDLRGRAFVGARIHGSRNVVSFVNAFYGLRAWDAWQHDPTYLDQFLASPDKKPHDRLIYKDSE